MKLGVTAALVDGRFVPGDVEIADGRIAGFGLVTSNGRGVAVPGFVDLQVNGFGGVDFFDADAEGYRRAGEALLDTGVTAYLPTSSPPPKSSSSPPSARCLRDRTGPASSAFTSKGRFSPPCDSGSIPPPPAGSPTWTCSNACSMRGRSDS